MFGLAIQRFRPCSTRNRYYINNYTEYLTLPHKGINPLKHTSDIIIWNAWPGHRRVPTLSRNTRDYYIECLAWPHKGLSTIKHTKINSELHAWTIWLCKQLYKTRVSELKNQQRITLSCRHGPHRGTNP